MKCDFQELEVSLNNNLSFMSVVDKYSKLTFPAYIYIFLLFFHANIMVCFLVGYHICVGGI